MTYHLPPKREDICWKCPICGLVWLPLPRLWQHMAAEHDWHRRAVSDD